MNGLAETAEPLASGLITRLDSLWTEASTIWLSGGGAMIAIASIARVMFCVGMNVWFKLRSKGFLSVPEKTWRRWLELPTERRGPIGSLIERAVECTTLEGIKDVFEHLRAEETAPFERDLKVMKVCVSAAPLVGLLGTVIGMLATFGALATGSGGDKTMALVAEGISEALITTETGLVVAIPGLFFQYQIVRRFERYKVFLAHLETVCTQSLYRQLRQRDRNAARKEAVRTVAQRLYDRLEAQRVTVQTPTPAPSTPTAEREPIYTF